MIRRHWAFLFPRAKRFVHQPPLRAFHLTSRLLAAPSSHSPRHRSILCVRQALLPRGLKINTTGAARRRCTCSPVTCIREGPASQLFPLHSTHSCPLALGLPNPSQAQRCHLLSCQNPAVPPGESCHSSQLPIQACKWKRKKNWVSSPSKVVQYLLAFMEEDSWQGAASVWISITKNKACRRGKIALGSRARNEVEVKLL